MKSINMVKSNDMNLSLIVDAAIYDNWDDDDQFLKKGSDYKLESRDRTMMSRIKSLML